MMFHARPHERYTKGRVRYTCAVPNKVEFSSSIKGARVGD